MNFTPEPNPRIQALAERTAKQIKKLKKASDNKIERLYKQYMKKANALRCPTTQTTEVPDVEVSAEDLTRPSADSSPLNRAND